MIFFFIYLFNIIIQQAWIEEEKEKKPEKEVL